VSRDFMTNESSRRPAKKIAGARVTANAGKRNFRMHQILQRPPRRNSSSHQVTERQCCRQCRSKLPAPTDIPQYAFCTPFCWQQFYRGRCLVCEEPIRRRAEHQKACIRRECKNDLRRYPHLYQCPQKGRGSQNVVTPLRSADKTGTKMSLRACRASALQWRASAGRIVGPAHVLAAEVFGGRDWRPTVSGGGVAIEIGRLRQRTLVDRDNNWIDWPVATNEAAHPEPRNDGLGIPASLRRRAL
jgi:hypothetical protein